MYVLFRATFAIHPRWRTRLLRLRTELAMLTPTRAIVLTHPELGNVITAPSCTFSGRRREGEHPALGGTARPWRYERL